jgi:hypothetical protein
MGRTIPVYIFLIAFSPFFWRNADMQIILISILLLTLAINSTSFSQDTSFELDVLYTELAAIDVSATPAEEDQVVDSDGDGLSDSQEEQMGTDPGNPDTDGGGVSDGAEVSNDDWRQTDPLNPFDDNSSEPSNDSVENANDQSSTEESGLTNEELAEELTSAANACGAIAAGFGIAAIVAAETGVGWPAAVLFGVIAGGVGLLGAAFSELANQTANSDQDPLP